MKRRAVLLIAIVVLVFAAGVGAAGYYVYRTVSNTGQQAVEMMNGEERAALKLLSSIDRNMTAEQVYEKLGPPTEDFYLQARWNGFGGSPLSQARVYFIDGHPRKIRWIKLGYFVYERNL
jgi:hypothetical protein